MTRSAPQTETLALVLRVLACIVVSVAVVGITGRIVIGDVSRWRAIPFPSLPRTPTEIISIGVNNGRILFSIIGAAIAVSSPVLARVPDGPTRRIHLSSLVRVACDFLLLTLVARNVLTVGTGIAMYGERMLKAIVPHGLIEMAAVSCALALYLRVRRDRVDVGTWAVLIASATGLVAVAAVVEVYVVL